MSSYMKLGCNFVLFLLLICQPLMVSSTDQGGPSLLWSIPKTSFTCQGRPGGYYGDVEAGCQVYHMCGMFSKQFSYLCPNFTLFHQKFMVCDHWNAVDCSLTPEYYDLNLQIGKGGGSTSKKPIFQKKPTSPKKITSSKITSSKIPTTFSSNTRKPSVQTNTRTFPTTITQPKFKKTELETRTRKFPTTFQLNRKTPALKFPATSTIPQFKREKMQPKFKKSDIKSTILRSSTKSTNPQLKSKIPDVETTTRKFPAAFTSRKAKISPRRDVDTLQGLSLSLTPPTGHTSQIPNSVKNSPGGFPNFRRGRNKISIDGRGDTSRRFLFSRSDKDSNELLNDIPKFSAFKTEKDTSLFDEDDAPISQDIPTSPFKATNGFDFSPRDQDDDTNLPTPKFVFLPHALTNPIQLPNISSLILPPPPESPIVINGQNQEIRTPLVVSRRTGLTASQINGILSRELTLPVVGGNPAFFIPSPGIISPIKGNTLRRNSSPTLNRFPQSIRNGRRPPVSFVNSSCPHCDPKFLQNNSCFPCLPLKKSV